MTSSPCRYVDVLLPWRVPAFTYAVSPGEADLMPGMRVAVPFRSRPAVGIVVTCREHLPPGVREGAVKQVLAVLDQKPLLPERLLQWWQRLADYYLVPPGAVLAHALPAALLWDDRTVVRVQWTNDEIPEAGREVWRFVQEAGGAVSLKMIKKKAEEKAGGTAAWMTAVDVLLRSGRLEVVIREDAPATPLSVWVRCPQRAHETVPQRAVRQRRLLTACRAESEKTPDGWVPLEKVLENAGASRAVFRALLKRDAVEVALRPVVPPTPTPTPLPSLPSAAPFRQRRITYHPWGNETAWRRLLALVKDRLDAGRQVVLLVPDAWAVSEYGNRLRRHFPDAVFFVTAELPDQEVVKAFNHARQGTPGVYVGARRPLFWPYRRLGAVIVLGENSAFLKNRFDPFAFHVRDVAVSRFRIEDVPLWLSAYAPSTETYFNVTQGRYDPADPESWLSAPAPHFWDLRAEETPDGFSHHWTPGLQQKVFEAIARGGRVLVVVNQRGTASYLGCSRCRWVARCPRCDVALTYYHDHQRMKCDHCGYSMPVPHQCPRCRSATLRIGGEGVAGVAAYLATRLARKVSAAERSAYPTFRRFYQKISPFLQGRTPVLVTTPYGMRPMTVRGVSLLIVTGVDTLLAAPSYRAGEQLWATIAKGGRLIRQYGTPAAEYWVATRHWEHPIWEMFRHQDGEAFYQEELAQRRRFGYPPMARLISVVMAHRRLKRHHRKIADFVRNLKQALAHAEVLWNPEKQLFREGMWQTEVMIKLPRHPQAYRRLKQRLAETVEQLQPSLRPLEVWFDVDPWE